MFSQKTRPIIKRIWLVLVVLGIILALLVYCLFLPQKPIKNPHSVRDIDITFYGEEISTLEYDQVKLAAILADITCVWDPFPRGPYFDADGYLKIFFMADERPFHIVLGNINFFNAPVGFFQYYSIPDAQTLRTQIEECIGQ